MGGIFIVGGLDHLQIQTIGVKPFLIANSIIPCMKIVSLKRYVCEYGDEFV